MVEMDSRSITRRTPRFLNLPSTLLLSILTFTTSISAQSTSATPTTFQTSQSGATLSSSTTPPQTSSTSNPSNPTNTADDNNNNDNRSAFSYYFLIIAAAIILLGAFALWFRSRQRRKAMLARSSSQRALASDVEGFRSRFNFGGGAGAFGMGGATYRGMPRTRTRRGAGEGEVEGLDERGEAPPPYVEGQKPPSIRESRSDGLPEGEEVEMRDLGHEPPSYDELRGHGEVVPTPASAHVAGSTVAPLTEMTRTSDAVERSTSTEVARPPTAVTAPERS